MRMQRRIVIATSAIALGMVAVCISLTRKTDHFPISEPVHTGNVELEKEPALAPWRILSDQGFKWGVLAPVRGEDGTPATRQDYLRRYEEVVRKHTGVKGAVPVEIEEDTTTHPYKLLVLDGPRTVVFKTDVGCVTVFADSEAFSACLSAKGQSSRERELRGAEKVKYLKLIKKALVDQLGFEQGTAMALHHVCYYMRNGQAKLKAEWRMIYHGFVHDYDGFGTTIDITDKANPNVAWFRNFGSKIKPPPPEIKVSEIEAVESAKKALTGWAKTCACPQPRGDFEIRWLRESGQLERQYVYRNDRYVAVPEKRWIETEETHFVYIVKLVVVPPGRDPKEVLNEDRLWGYTVWVDCRDGAIVGGHQTIKRNEPE